jgi:hypothetical protein
MSQPEIVLERLEDQLQWYDRKATRNERMFKRLKKGTLAISVSIPLSAAFAVRYPAVTGVITGALGATIALLEGLQQLNQYHQNWIAYRSTAEALKHEKFLFLGAAGPYSNPAAERADPKVLLAERVESLVSQENSKWTQAQEQTGKTQASSNKH